MVICAELFVDIAAPESAKPPGAPLGKPPIDPPSACDVATNVGNVSEPVDRKGHVPRIDRKIGNSTAINISTRLPAIVSDCGRLLASIDGTLEKADPIRSDAALCEVGS